MATPSERFRFRMATREAISRVGLRCEVMTLKRAPDGRPYWHLLVYRLGSPMRDVRIIVGSEIDPYTPALAEELAEIVALDETAEHVEA